jgi:SNF2 family DNA or RNA helicase
LFDSLLLRRTKTQQLETGRPMIELPPREYRLHKVILSADERSVYSQLESTLKKSVKSIHQASPSQTTEPSPAAAPPASLLVGLLRLQQACIHLSLIKEPVSLDDSVNSMDGSPIKAKKPTEIEKDDFLDEITDQISKLSIFPSASSEVEVTSSKISAFMLELDRTLLSEDQGKPSKAIVISQWTRVLDMVSQSRINAFLNSS